MSTLPTDRKYLPSHEWHRVTGSVVEIGITQFAADELTDVTYIKLPKVGAQLTQGKPFSEVESVKATSDIYSGITGTVIEVNDALANDPGLINRDPYNGAWIARVQISGPDAVSGSLLDAPAYLKAIGH